MFHFAGHVADFVKDGEALLEDGTAGEDEALLRKIADAHAARGLQRAVVQGFQAGQDLHQGGFAGAVGAHKRGLFLAANEPVGFKEENTRAEAFAGILE